MEKINKKILIAEDDLDFGDIIEKEFSRAGFDVSLAKDGLECLEMAKEVNPDLIMLDILMPKMDGIETAQKLKESGIKIPIIFLTNVSDENSISRALETTQSDYIIKSDMRVEKIVQRVKEKLGIK